jgi:hypothetical protein
MMFGSEDPERLLALLLERAEGQEALIALERGHDSSEGRRLQFFSARGQKSSRQMELLTFPATELPDRRRGDRSRSRQRHTPELARGCPYSVMRRQEEVCQKAKMCKNKSRGTDPQNHIRR